MKVVGTWRVKMKLNISSSYSLMGSFPSCDAFLSKDLDFLCSFPSRGFSEMEWTLDLRSRLVMSLPNTRLLLFWLRMRPYMI